LRNLFFFFDAASWQFFRLTQERELKSYKLGFNLTKPVLDEPSLRDVISGDA